MPITYSGYYTLKTPAGNALDITGGSNAQGAALLLWKAHDGNNQKFLFTAINGGKNRIQGAQHRLSIDISGAAAGEGAAAIMWPVHGAANQQFYLVPSGDGWLYVRASHGPYLAAASDSSGEAVLTTLDLSKAQRFRPQQTGFYSWTSGIPALDAKLEFIMNNYIGTSGDIMRKCYDYTRSYSYRSGSLYPSGNWVPGFANEMIDYGSGNCYRFAALLGMLYAYNNISCNVISGGVILGSGSVGPHSWVEVYVNGQTYVVDPEATKDLPGYNFYMNTYGSAPIVYVH
jgi:hypothetical protein